MLPEHLILSSDLADGATLRAHARLVAREAYGAEFRITAADGTRIYTTIAEIEVWQPCRSPLPAARRETIWETGSCRDADAASLRLALRVALDEGVRSGILAEADALGLRRAADLIIEGRLPG